MDALEMSMKTQLPWARNCKKSVATNPNWHSRNMFPVLWSTEVKYAFLVTSSDDGTKSTPVCFGSVAGTDKLTLVDFSLWWEQLC